MSLINVSRDFKRHQLDGCMFLGIVEDNEDPLFLQRLKVRIVEVFGTEIPTDLLPWTVPVRSNGFGSGGGLSHFTVPLVGSKVLVEFHRGDIYSPMVIGIVMGLEDVSEDFSTNYPFRYGDKDRNKTKTIVDTQELTWLFSHISGIDIEIKGLPNTPLTPTFLSSTSFSLEGEQELIYHVGKGVRATLNPVDGEPYHVFSKIASTTEEEDPTIITLEDPILDSTVSEVDVTLSEIRITHPWGTTIYIDSDGNVNAEGHPEAIANMSFFDINLNAINNIVINAGLNLNLQGGGYNLNLNSGGAQFDP